MSPPLDGPSSPAGATDPGAPPDAPARPASARILIVGFGSALAGDDGAGPAVIAALPADLGGGARAIEGGTDALRLPSLWRGQPEVWIVDALAPGDPAGPPGTVVELPHEALLALPQAHAGAHALSLPEALRLLPLAFPETSAVRYRLFGIVAGSLAPLAPLSPAVRRAVADLADLIARRVATT